MSKIWFWIALVVLVVLALRKKMRTIAKNAQAQGQASAERTPQVEAESMARCAHCGLHFPASEAVTADGQAYCSPAHLRLPPAQ
jgi:uncharacterized protein